MQKSNSHQATKMVRRRMQSSTTLNRKYVKRPARSSGVTAPIKKSQKLSHFSESQAMQANHLRSTNQKVGQQAVESVQPHPIQQIVNTKMQTRNTAVRATQNLQPKKMSAKELKDQAIKKALASASDMSVAEQVKKGNEDEAVKTGKMRFGIGRVVLALSCAAAAVFAIAYFVNLNMPDISLRVAAMQSGIDATYPNYIPSDYNVASITSENSKISLTFNKAKSDDSFVLTEEKSTWDSNALLTNFVKNEYGEEYSIIREQGITIYINNSNAAWVNGGIVYKIEATDKALTEKQIRSIAVSL